jgi:PTH2 family peptidyl-tRNA hydrolase
MIKQVICVRSDLKNNKGDKVRSGKLCAQVAHASMKVFFDLPRGIIHFGNVIQYQISLPEGIAGKDMNDWVEGIFTKICCSVNSEEELLKVYNLAKEKGLPCSLIQDAGLTEFGGVPTYTCCAIGPARSEFIDPITGKLSLL